MPEFDGTLFTFEVEDEEILDEDDDVGDLHAIHEGDHEEDIEDTKPVVVRKNCIQRFSFQVLILGMSWIKAREKVQERALCDLFTGGFLTQEVMQHLGYKTVLRMGAACQCTQCRVQDGRECREKKRACMHHPREIRGPSPER